MKKGFTLIEVLIVGGLISLILGAILSMFLTGQASWTSVQTKTTVQDETRKAIQTIYRELRESNYNPDPAHSHLFIENNGQQVTFQVPVLVGNTVSLDGAGDIRWGCQATAGHFLRYAVVNGQLIRYTLNTDRVTILAQRIVANDITGLNFNLINIKTLEITITAQRQDAHGRNWQNSLRTRVLLRN